MASSFDLRKDYFAILGLSAEASTEEIERAYRQLARQWHPDFNPHPEAHERMAEINEAYRVLRDPDLRAQYRQARRLYRRLPPTDPHHPDAALTLWEQFCAAAWEWYAGHNHRALTERLGQHTEQVYRALQCQILRTAWKDDFWFTLLVHWPRQRRDWKVWATAAPVLFPDHLQPYEDDPDFPNLVIVYGSVAKSAADYLTARRRQWMDRDRFEAGYRKLFHRAPAIFPPPG